MCERYFVTSLVIVGFMVVALSIVAESSGLALQRVEENESQVKVERPVNEQVEEALAAAATTTIGDDNCRSESNCSGRPIHKHKSVRSADGKQSDLIGANEPNRKSDTPRYVDLPADLKQWADEEFYIYTPEPERDSESDDETLASDSTAPTTNTNLADSDEGNDDDDESNIVGPVESAETDVGADATGNSSAALEEAAVSAAIESTLSDQRLNNNGVSFNRSSFEPKRSSASQAAAQLTSSKSLQMHSAKTQRVNYEDDNDGIDGDSGGEVQSDRFVGKTRAASNGSRDFRLSSELGLELQQRDALNEIQSTPKTTKEQSGGSSGKRRSGSINLPEIQVDNNELDRDGSLQSATTESLQQQQQPPLVELVPASPPPPPPRNRAQKQQASKSARKGTGSKRKKNGTRTDAAKKNVSTDGGGDDDSDEPLVGAEHQPYCYGHRDSVRWFQWDCQGIHLRTVPATLYPKPMTL